VQKVIPTTEHSIIQGAFLRVLENWADAETRGIAAAEWRFRVPSPDVDTHPLVPDVAFLSFARLPAMPREDRRVPTAPPEIVVEVLSPDDQKKKIEIKRKQYLSWGVSLQIEANPETRTVDVYTADGGHETIDARTCESYTSKKFPDLHFPLRAMFARLDMMFSDF
jgi:Uma2 family endonuclease